MTVRRLALWIFQLAVSIGLLAYLVITIPMRDVYAALISARLDWLLSGFTLVGAINLLAALQMRAILAAQGMAFSVRQIASVNLVANFYGLFPPSYLAGGVIRWHHFSRPEGKRAQALAAMAAGTTCGFKSYSLFAMPWVLCPSSVLRVHWASPRPRWIWAGSAPLWISYSSFRSASRASAFAIRPW
jgi:uncharacterized membrane protein YbhN (UPF0104 family)